MLICIDINNNLLYGLIANRRLTVINQIKMEEKHYDKG